MLSKALQSVLGPEGEYTSGPVSLSKARIPPNTGSDTGRMSVMGLVPSVEAALARKRPMALGMGASRSESSDGMDEGDVDSDVDFDN
jgi:hypothetical protein